MSLPLLLKDTCTAHRPAKHADVGRPSMGALKMTSLRTAAHSLCSTPQKLGGDYAAFLRCTLWPTISSPSVALSPLRPDFVVSISQLRLQPQLLPGYGSACSQPHPACWNFFTRPNHPGRALLSYDVLSGRSANELSTSPSTDALVSCETPQLFSDRKRKVLNGTEYIRRKTGYRGRIRRGRQAPC